MSNMEVDLESGAVKEALELLLDLKKSGLLSLLKEMVSSADGIMEDMQADTSTLRLALLIGAVLEASRRLKAEKVIDLKMNTENAAYCLFDSLASTKPEESQPKGLMGLMGALRDEDVQLGLGYLIGIAKNLGSCVKSLKKQ